MCQSTQGRGVRGWYCRNTLFAFESILGLVCFTGLAHLESPCVMCLAISLFTAKYCPVIGCNARSLHRPFPEPLLHCSFTEKQAYVLKILPFLAQRTAETLCFLRQRLM